MSESDQSGAGRREVAYRLFAAEFDDADYSYSESDEERAPNYVITPTGARVNRLFVVGVLTEIEEVSEDVLRARVADPTGAFVLYAGQYQPDEQAFLDGADTPMFVAVTGKARTFQPEDSDRVFTSVRPESISEVDATTRDRWTVQTAEQTLHRVGRMAAALDSDLRGEDLRSSLEDSGVDEGLAAGIPLAIDHYGTTAGYLAELRTLAIDAARLVADEIDEVETLSVAPDEGADTDPGKLADTDLELTAPAAGTPTDEEPATESVEATATSGDDTAETTTTASTGSESTETETVDAETAETDTATETEPAEVETTTVTESTDTETTAEAESESNVDSEADTETPIATTEAGSGESAAEPSETESADQTESTGISETTDTSAEDDDIGDFDPGEFELDEDEREEIEEEYGTEFQSGTDVPEPGEVDIDTPDPEEAEAESATDTQQAADAASEDVSAAESADTESTATESTADTEPVADDEPTTDTDETATEETPPEDVDLEDAAVDLMGDLDDGDGADHGAVVEALLDQYGVSEAEADDAIQDALMDGRCYEPDDGKLKPI